MNMYVMTFHMWSIVFLDLKNIELDTKDRLKRSTLSRFIGGNVFWWQQSLISNFGWEPLELRRVSRRDF